MRAKRQILLMLASTWLGVACPSQVDIQGIDGGAGTIPPWLPTLRDAGDSLEVPANSAEDGGALADGGTVLNPPGTLDGGSPVSLPDGGPAPFVDAGSSDAGAPGGAPVYVAGRGDACFPAGGTVCEAALICVGVFPSGAGTCEYPCDTAGESCVTGGLCTLFAEQGEWACATQVSEGQACDAEALIVCAEPSVCLPDETSVLSGTCRTPCLCSDSNTCADDACGPEVCVAINTTTGAGYCGGAVPLGGACAPVKDAELCASGENETATCLVAIETPGEGTCRRRCTSAGDCAGLNEFGCFGAPDGLCLPLTGRMTGETCTLDGTTPAVSCAAGFSCIRTHEELPLGYGVCLEPCVAVADCTRPSESCYLLPDTAGGGAHCLRELPRGGQGCDPPEPTCGGESDLCVNLSADDSVCKLGCTIANCPGASCECSGPEVCHDAFIASDVTGVCGQQVGLFEACDEERDIYCARAPGEEVPGHAFAACVDRCVYVCHFEPAGAAVVDLTCPDGLVCAEDPTGRLLPSVHICVPPPGT